jgi:hypothetical protein
MARRLRIQHPGAMYHVMNRGDQREAIFRDGEDRERFLVQPRNATQFGQGTQEPQRLGAAEPQPNSEHPMNRRDATSAEKSKRTKILLKMRDSPLLHCEGRGDSELFVFSALQ